jgi:hypothetical protein
MHTQRHAIQIRHQFIRTKTAGISGGKDDDCDLFGLHYRRPRLNARIMPPAIDSAISGALIALIATPAGPSIRAHCAALTPAAESRVSRA